MHNIAIDIQDPDAIVHIAHLLRHRENLTIILAGYKQDIECKLFEYNDGFFRRFPFKLQFDDYNDEELAQIFQQLCERRNWQWESYDVIRCAARKSWTTTRS
jgi:hypothetical protein